MRSAIKFLPSVNAVLITCLTIIITVLLYLWQPPILDFIELKTYDLRFVYRGVQPITGKVVLALIDEKSLDEEGRWPWPRSKIARLIDVLSSQGAKVIGFDMGFFEPDENSELKLIRQLGRTIKSIGVDSKPLNAFIASRQKNADNDLALADAMKRSAADSIAGYFFHFSESDLEKKLTPPEIDARLGLLRKSKYPLVIFDRNPSKHQTSQIVQALAPESNIDVISHAASDAGFFHVTPSRDGGIRKMPLIIQCGQDLFPHLAIMCAWHYLGKPVLMVKMAANGVSGIQIGDRVVPTDESGQLLIDYLGPPKTIPHISISDILNGRTDNGAFRNKIVLVGATAMGTYDLRNTPFSPKFPGVEIHATVIENILKEKFMTRPEWSRVFDLAAIVLLGILAGTVLSRVSALKGLLVVLVLFSAHIAVAYWLFAAYGVWLNIVYPLLTLGAAYIGITAYRYMTVERERRKIKGAFRQYVAPLVIERMLEAPDRLQLGGEEKVLTVLFSDLERFTSYSEKYTPHEMTSFLSQYFELMTEQVFRFQGTLKEYVGDELMAIFGAPLEHPDHAHRACAVALAMQARRRELRKSWAQSGRPLLRARTGINSGPMLVGNLGCRYRFAYGALGDQVNLASRLEGLNKFYGTSILIGENTARLVGDSFALREVDKVRVVGKQQCINIFELVAAADTVLPADTHRVLKLYAEGYEAYCARNWDEAVKAFDACLALHPEDGPSRTMIGRSREYRHIPPPDDWDCVYEATSK